MFSSNDERLATLDTWLHDYNWTRTHSALGNHPPASRLTSTTRPGATARCRRGRRCRRTVRGDGPR
ncbi:MAG: integrase core domain-containing protein [Ilumatobacteraceae bacterium]